MPNELWPHIADALRDLRASIGQGVRRIVCQAPTGSGKTSLAAAIIEGATHKGKRVSFVVPAISLIDQTVERFWADGIRDVGVIQANHPMTDWSQPVQVCSVQTLKERGEYPRADIVIRDECHVLFDFDREWMAHSDWRSTPFIGLSATPWTKGLGKHYESLLVAARIGDLIEGGLLSRFTTYACPKGDTSGVKVITNKDGEKDFHQGQLSTVQRGAELTADVVRTWRDKWGKGKSLYFAVDRAHAETLHLRFKAAGVTAAYQDGETSDGDRKAIERGFHNGTHDVVVNIGTLTTGTDWDVRCLGLCRPTKSEKLYVQIIGRGLRVAAGKDRLVILDHTDSWDELGFVTDIHHEHLDGGKAQRAREVVSKARPLRSPCPECASLNPRVARVCPDCGHRLPLASGVVERDGVLVELAPGQAIPRGGKREWPVEERRRFHAELMGYARDRGKERKWVLANYREKFGAFPPFSWNDDAPAEPSFEVANWVKSRMIAFAKRRQKKQRMHGEAAE